MASQHGPRLIFTDDRGARRHVPLHQEPVTLGRARENTIAFTRTDTVSRFHAELTPDGPRWVLMDRGSSAGTSVNGMPILEHVMMDGDVIQLGGVSAPTLTFVDTVVLRDDATDPVAPVVDEPMTLMVPADTVFLNPALLNAATAEASGGATPLAERLRALYSITSSLLSIGSVPDLCTQVLRMVFDVLPADRGAVLLLGDEEALTVRAMRTRRGDEETFQPSGTIVGRALQDNVAVMTVDAAQDARFATGESVMMQSIRSVMCAPISAGSDILGAVYLDTTVERNTFAEEDLEFLVAVTRQAALALQKLELLDNQKKTFESMMRALAHSIDARDGITAGHSSRVAKYSQAIARHMGMDAAQCRVIWYAGLLHDYGKIGTREAVLCKPSALTPEEYEHIKEHPKHTLRILSSIQFAPELADIPRMASSHHERPDGKGYPFGWKGDETPMGGRIIAVADFFDALTVKRHYREPAPLQEVLEMMRRGRDTQFDGAALDAFFLYVDEEYLPHQKRVAARKALEGFATAGETTSLAAARKR